MFKHQRSLKFMDFCAGIGGGRIGLENIGMECVGFSEIDKKAEETYRLFFGESEKNYGNCMNINPDNLPDFDLMIAGFPCQTFSIIGKRAGTRDPMGQIIYGLINIMVGKNLKYFILENVKGLVNHKGGQTIKTILKKLDKAGYKVYWKLTNSLKHGVPQMRERIYFVGIRKDLIKNNMSFEFLDPVLDSNLKDYLIDTGEFELKKNTKALNGFFKYLNSKYNKDLTAGYMMMKFVVKLNLFGMLNNNYLQEEYLVLDTRQSDLRLYRGKVPTLRSGRHGIMYIRDGKLRKLSGYESLLLQGFSKELAEKARQKIANACLLRQAGNAMTINVVEHFGKSLLNNLN